MSFCNNISSVTHMVECQEHWNRLRKQIHTTHRLPSYLWQIPQGLTALKACLDSFPIFSGHLSLQVVHCPGKFDDPNLLGTLCGSIMDFSFNIFYPDVHESVSIFCDVKTCEWILPFPDPASHPHQQA